jgi:hypothetical protein
MSDSLVAIAGQPLPPIAPIFIGMLLGGGIGAAIGKAKGRVGLGLVLGMFLGLIGWIIVAVLPSKNLAQPQGFAGGPFCQTCRGPGRWIPESNGWGCDRCRTMIMTQPYPMPGQMPHGMPPQGGMPPGGMPPGGMPPGGMPPA